MSGRGSTGLSSTDILEKKGRMDNFCSKTGKLCFATSHSINVMFIKNTTASYKISSEDTRVVQKKKIVGGIPGLLKRAFYTNAI